MSPKMFKSSCSLAVSPNVVGELGEMGNEGDCNLERVLPPSFSTNLDLRKCLGREAVFLQSLL